MNEAVKGGDCSREGRCPNGTHVHVAAAVTPWLSESIHAFTQAPPEATPRQAGAATEH